MQAGLHLCCSQNSKDRFSRVEVHLNQYLAKGTSWHAQNAKVQVSMCSGKALEGGPSIPYPFNYFEKYPMSLKLIWQISQKFKKHCIPISLKLIQVSRIPLSIYKNILYPFKFLANIPVSLKTLPMPQWRPHSLISVLVFCLKKRGTLGYSQSAH